MSGRDVKRGTFSHRHAVIYDETNNKEDSRLSNLGENQGNLRIYVLTERICRTWL